MAWYAGIARLQGASAASAPLALRRDYGDGSSDWGWAPFGVMSNTGLDINQGTALKATTVMAAVTMLAEDFAKCEPMIYRLDSASRRVEATDHELYILFYSPNDWQTGFEFREMMQFSLVMRGNAYAVKIRDSRGRVVKLIPVNADWVALWEAPSGELFYRVTPNGLHMRAELAGQPFLIPAEDMLHVKGFSMNGLVGASRIAIANDAIGLSLAYERQATQWFSNGAAPSGVLTTDQRLQDGAAKRMADDWRATKGGLQNSGKVLVLEQGLKYQQIAMSAQAAEFIASRNFQIQEVTRIFRIPAHMLGDLQKAAQTSIEQLSQEYINLTITGYTSRWAARYSSDWNLRADGLYVDFDLSILTRANVTARYNNYARGITGGFLTQNEARKDDHRDPLPGGDVLLQPLNMSAQGSHATGDKADGGGRPHSDSADADVKAATTA
jgi:HK97 family phage portal protein